MCVEAQYARKRRSSPYQGQWRESQKTNGTEDSRINNWGELEGGYGLNNSKYRVGSGWDRGKELAGAGSLP
jgi:hypothetical protein